MASMVAALTYASSAHRADAAILEHLGVTAQSLKDRFLELLDEDTEAFHHFLAAKRLPKKNSSDRQARDKALLEAAKQMTEVPMETLRLAGELVNIVDEMIEKGMPAALSDATVAALEVQAAALGAYMNVRINLPMVDDHVFVEKTSREAMKIRDEVVRVANELVAETTEKLEA